MTISWQNPDRNPEDASVTIQRAGDANFTRNLTTFSSGPGETTFVDATCEAPAACWYRVRAESADGCSAWSDGVPVMPRSSGTP